MALIHRIAGERRRLVAFTFFTRLADESLPLAKPLLVGAIVDTLSRGAPGEGSFRVLLGGLVMFAIGRALTALAYGLASARLGRGSAARLRAALVDTWLDRGLGALDLGDAVTRSGRDIDRMRSFVDRVYVRGPTGAVRAVGPILFLVAIDPMLAMLALSVLPVQHVFLLRLESRMQVAARRSSEASASFVGALTHALQRRGDRDEARDGRLRAQVQEIERAELAVAHLQAGVRGIVVLGSGIGLALVWIFASAEVARGDMSVGELISFTGFTELVYRPFRQLASVSKTYRTGLASLERVADAIRDRSASAPARRAP